MSSTMLGKCVQKRKRKEETEVESLNEHVNVLALKELASRKASGIWKPYGGATLRTILFDFITQIKHNHIQTVWREEDRMTSLGLKGRRYSGYHAQDQIEHCENIKKLGVNEKSIGRSMFSLPGWLRDIGRFDLCGCYVLDMVNAHVVIQSKRHKRHPKIRVLKTYISQREDILKSIPAPNQFSEKEARDAAKQLFIRLIYGGTPQKWCQDFGVKADLPKFVSEFKKAQDEIRKKDMEDNPQIVNKLRDPKINVGFDLGEGHTICDLLQYVLNTTEERRVIDLISEAMKANGTDIDAFEHDGLFLKSKLKADRILKIAQDACGYQVTIKKCAEYDFETLLNNVAKKADFADLDLWRHKDDGWEEMESLIQEARRTKLTSHDIFAAVLIKEKQVSESIPWPLKDLFKKPRLAQNYVWYDVDHSVWVEGGSNGVDRLKDYITSMLENLLSEYEIADHLHTKLIINREFGNRSFREGVESCLRSKLVVDDLFHLDPKASLRYLNFNGTAWDRDTESWVRTSPDMLISRSTGWEFTEYTNPETEKVDKALKLIREDQDHRGIEKPSEVPPEAAKLLDEASLNIPELKFWFDFTRDWECTLYELSHLVRGLFGILMAEALYVRGPGRNGKDTVCNAMAQVGGTYVTSISCDALSQITSADSPSPTFAGVRARRIVCVREVSKEANIKSEVYKKFTDPFSELTGRNLYEHLVKFSPQYLAFFASNGPIKIAMDNAVRERTAIIDHVSVFKDNPIEANDVKWTDMNQLLPKFRPGFFWIFRRVYHHLIKDRSRRNVGPIPMSSIEQKSIDCADANTHAFISFIQSLTPVQKPSDATPQTEIDKRAMEMCGVSDKEVGLYLSGKGFVKLRRKRGLDNVYLYQYRFEIEGVKGNAQYVQLALKKSPSE